jgi:ribose/xylose/arabinose/galactoside ABC-type transport system permease subunit
MNFLDIIGQFFWFGILATPVLSFLIVRKAQLSVISKIMLGTLTTLLLAAIFFQSH